MAGGLLVSILCSMVLITTANPGDEEQLQQMLEDQSADEIQDVINELEQKQPRVDSPQKVAAASKGVQRAKKTSTPTKAPKPLDRASTRGSAGVPGYSDPDADDAIAMDIIDRMDAGETVDSILSNPPVARTSATKASAGVPGYALSFDPDDIGYAAADDMDDMGYMGSRVSSDSPGKTSKTDFRQSQETDSSDVDEQGGAMTGVHFLLITGVVALVAIWCAMGGTTIDMQSVAIPGLGSVKLGNAQTEKLVTRAEDGWATGSGFGGCSSPSAPLNGGMLGVSKGGLAPDRRGTEGYGLESVTGSYALKGLAEDFGI